MSFAAYYRWSCYLSVAAGFLAVAGTGALGPAPMIAFTAVLAAAGLMEAGRLRRIPAGRFAPAIAMASLPAAWVEYRLLTHSLVLTAAHLLLFLAALKLTAKNADRDDAYACALSFGLILCAALLTDGMAFLLFLSFFIVMAVSTLIVFEMKWSSTRARKKGMLKPLVAPRILRGTEFELFGGFSSRQMLAVSLGLSLFIALAAVPLFFLLPRTSFGARFSPGIRPRLISGFSEKVTLGEIGSILESGDLVMKVKTEGPHGSGAKWRGIALDYFDGKSWICSRSDRERVPVQGGYFKLQETARSGSLLLQTVFLEPMATDVVFGAHQVLAVSTDLGLLKHDQHDNVYSEGSRHGTARYSVVSDTTPPDPGKIPPQPGRLPDAIAARYLQLPALDPRIAELAQRIAGRAANPYDQARALENYLRTQYGYSLRLKGRPDSPDPLAMFLFEVRSGHCEYFASALTVMLREAGIPARMVNGFRTGDYNPVSGHWTVRQYHAHSWVEAWFPPYGWIEFDPTPPDPRLHQAGYWLGISRFFDALDLWWSDSMIHYDVRKQSQLLRGGIASLQRSLGIARQAIAGLERSSRAMWSGRAQPGWIAALAALVLAATVILAGRPRIRRLRELHRIRQNPEAAVTGFYAEALSMLQKRGFARIRSETPLEFASRMAPQPFGEALAALTSLYYRIRFAKTALPEDMGRARQLLQILKAPDR